MAQPKRIHVISKAASILRLFPGTDSLSLTEIARELDANPASVYHILQTLVDEGFLEQDAGTRRYVLGPTLLSLAPPRSQSVRLLAAASEPLHECSRATGFDVWLGQLELDRVYYIARVDGESPLKVHMPLLQLQPAHAVSAGRMLLACQTPQQAREMLELHTLRRKTATTCTDVEIVLAEVARARAQGWAEVDGENIHGAADISVPVPGLNDSAIAAVTIGAPSQLLGPDRRKAVLPHLLRAAAAIHTALFPTRSGQG